VGPAPDSRERPTDAAALSNVPSWDATPVASPRAMPVDDAATVAWSTEAAEPALIDDPTPVEELHAAQATLSDADTEEDDNTAEIELHQHNGSRPPSPVSPHI